MRNTLGGGSLRLDCYLSVAGEAAILEGNGNVISCTIMGVFSCTFDVISLQLIIQDYVKLCLQFVIQNAHLFCVWNAPSVQS